MKSSKVGWEKSETDGRNDHETIASFIFESTKLKKKQNHPFHVKLATEKNKKVFLAKTFLQRGK